MTLPQPAPSVSDQTPIVSVDRFHLEPRCRVCNEQIRTTVNDLLAAGASYAMILRTLKDDNDNLDDRDRVSIDSIRNHTARHFPVQNVAKATYRAVLERRAQQNAVDFAEGLATAITPMAVLDVAMITGFATLVDDDTVVDYRDGVAAALRLHELTRKDAGAAEVAEIIARQNRIIAAMREFVPEHQQLALIARIAGRDGPPQQDLDEVEEQGFMPPRGDDDEQ